MFAKSQVIEVREVPTVVVSSFQTTYPSVTKVQWQRVGSNYEALYRDNQGDVYVTYDPSGKLIETGQGIVTTSVPEPVTTYVKTKYKGDKLTKVYKVKDANGVVLYKGKVKDKYVFFDSNGNFIREDNK